MSGTIYGQTVLAFHTFLRDLGQTMLSSVNPPTSLDASLVDVNDQTLTLSSFSSDSRPAFSIAVSPVPTPATLPLFLTGLGLLGLIMVARRGLLMAA
jgi:hypothetical protein